MVVGQAQRLHRTAGVDGGLKQCRTEPTVFPAAEGCSLWEGNHSAAVAQSVRHGIDDPGECVKAPALDGDDVRQTCQQADRLSEGASAGRDPRAEAASTLAQRHRIGAAAHDDVIDALPTLRAARGR
jgi:hypothetical protein